MSDMTSSSPPLDFEIATADGGRAALPIVSGRARMTAMQAVRAGIALAWRNVWLVLLVWIVFLTLAWVAALPAWRWWDRVLSLAPEGDRLLSGLNVALLRELSHYDRSPTIAIALGSAFTFFLFALVLNPFVAGGTLGVLGVPGLRGASSPSSLWSSRRDGESGSGSGSGSALPISAMFRVSVAVPRQFVAEGMRWYWRFARILLLVGILGGGISLLLMTGFEAAGVALEERGFPRASMWVDDLMLLMVAIVFGVSSLIVDVSRIFMMRRDDDRTAAAVKQALGFIRRNVGAVLAIGAAFVVLLAAAIVIYNLIASGITPLSWGLIVFTIVWQQLFSVARTTLRVGLLAALGMLVDSRAPRPIEPPAYVPPVDEPVYELPALG